MSLFRLPPYTVEMLMSASELAQVVDYGLLMTGVPEAWKVTRGRGVRCAVLDTGIDRTHRDLAGQWTVGPVDFTGSPFGPEDHVGHGTHTAGIIAAADNGRGVIGIAPESELLIGKVLGDDGSGRSEWIAAGIDWARRNSAHVISMSLGSPVGDPKIQAAIDRATTAGIFCLCAAGNSGPDNPEDVDFPARYPNCIAVASVNKDGKLSEFSSRGKHVAIAAPGENILSTFPGNRYARMSGTSFATPLVAGAVALLVARHKELGNLSLSPLKTRDDLVEHLRYAARDEGLPGPDTGSGWGLIQIDKLIGNEQSKPDAPPQSKEIDLAPYGVNLKIYLPARAGDGMSFGK